MTLQSLTFNKDQLEILEKALQGLRKQNQSFLMLSTGSRSRERQVVWEEMDLIEHLLHYIKAGIRGIS